MAGGSRSLVVGLFAFALVAAACDLPSLQEVRKSAVALPQTSAIYSADGRLITRLHAGENRIVVGSRKIPDVIRNAVIAIEDKRFYNHRGVDARALLRAAYIDATTGEIVEGGSTITQQLVKQLYVGDEQTVARKLKEAYLAWQLEQKLTKDQILTRYLNTVYFGNGAYGIRAAAQTYFDEEPLDLTLPQASLLAGLIAAPVNYDPVIHPTRAERRRNHVLELMQGLGMIDPAQREQAAASAVGLRLPPKKEANYAAPYFVDYVKEWFLSNPHFGDTPQERYDLLFEGGLRIVTTLDPRMQRAAEHAVSSVLTEGSDPYGALTSIDPRTGYVRAMVGGRDYWNRNDRFARINLATGGSTGRQAGSAFKPFALVAALEHGIPRTQPLNGSTAHILLNNGTYWDPQNAEGGGYGTISLESATINSVNVAYANLLSVIGAGDPYAGAAAIVEAATRMGIRCCPRTSEPNGPLAAVPSAVLGVNEVSTLEMASAYGTLAYLGRHVQPTPVISVTTRDGDVLYHANVRAKQVVEPPIAAEAVDILKGVVRSGTGVGANIGRPQFGKTGTAQNASDAWFVGAVPQLVTAVWVGFPQGQIPMCCGNVRISTVYGGTWPASIWKAFMAVATQGMPPKDFVGGPNIDNVTLRVDVKRGCLANRFTPPHEVHVYQWPAGSEPDYQVCTEPSSYQLLAVPSLIGMGKQAAIAALHTAGFTVAMVEVTSAQRAGTVIAQDPPGGSRLVQTGTVTITLASAATPSPEPVSATVPNVTGLPRGDAIALLRQAGFRVSVSSQQECDPAVEGCEYRQGIAWSQTPSGGVQADEGATVTIVVNP